MHPVNVRSAAWLQGMTEPPVEGGFGRLQRMRVQGATALATPAWALDTGFDGQSGWTPAHEAELVAAMRSVGARLAVVDLPAGVTADPGAQWKGWAVTRHTRLADLATSLPKHRSKQVRKARRLGLQSLTDPSALADMVALHQSARARKAIPSDAQELHRLLHALAPAPGTRFAFVQDASGACVAGGVFLLTAPDTVLYAFGGAHRSQHSGLATVLLLAEAMEWARGIGASTFDFGGSQDAGVDRFYKEFGGVYTPKLRWVVAPQPWKWWFRLRRPDLFPAP